MRLAAKPEPHDARVVLGRPVYRFGRWGDLAPAVESLDDVRVELGTGAGVDHGHRLFFGERVAVGAVGHERVVDVGNGDDSRGNRDVIAGQSVWIAAAVPALVV